MKARQYESKPIDAFGKIHWSFEENGIWEHLVSRQLDCIKDKACGAYFDGLDLLDLPRDHAPQIPDINSVLGDTTGWQLEPVSALIDFDRFFTLLSEKKFPVATFLRTETDMDYLKEPDFFHEVFGHCAMLTNPAFAAFTETYGRLGVTASKEERVYLARLYWFTVEFGLIQHRGGRTIYGGGILSSPAETDYAFSSGQAIYKPLDIVDVMRTPYRIDILQPIYFYLEDLETLFSFTHVDLMACVHQAMSLGLHSPLYPVKMAQ